MSDLTIPPINTDYEKGVLGCCLIESNCIDDAVAQGITSDSFHTPFHRQVWEVMTDLHFKGEHVDELSTYLKMGEASGHALADVNALTSTIQTSVSMPIYIQGCLGIWKSRKLHMGAITALDGIREGIDPDQVAKNLESTIKGLETGDDSDEDLAAHAIAFVERTKERNRNRDKLPGVGCGVPVFDNAGGFRPASLNILAGRPGMGKTAMAIQVGRQLGEAGVGSRFWSLEMTTEQLAERITCSKAGVDASRAGDGMMTESDFEKLMAATYDIGQLPFRISSRLKVTVPLIASKLRQDMNMHGDVGLVIIDYLQLVRPSDRRMKREEQIAEMSRELKGLAVETGVPVLLLCQLNREAEGSSRPEMKHLRESGAIEQDADMITMIWPNPQDASLADIYCIKNRQGRTGFKESMRFNKPISRFE